MFAVYHYGRSGLGVQHAYLLPAVSRLVRALKPGRLFELGCGNGAVADHFSDLCPVTAVDPSPEGIAVCASAYPRVRAEIGSAYDDLAGKYGQFPLVLSLEVIEHLYAPRLFAKTVWDLLEPGGTAIISTPYHGYLKNLVLAASGRLDAHFTALWEGGHIKFWSSRSLSRLLVDAGFEGVCFERVGRIPPLAKSMIAVARRPAEPKGAVASGELRTVADNASTRISTAAIA